jgi:positive control factor
VNDLITQYKQSLKNVRNLHRLADIKDKKIIAGMISDLEYAIEWMETCRRPGLKRGIERRAAYQRERPFDPLLMQNYFKSMDDNIYSWDDHIQEDGISPWDKLRVDDALSVLSEREKEIYLMSRGYCISYSQIADYLGITKATVQNNIKRAEKKIAGQIHSSLFALC